MRPRANHRALLHRVLLVAVLAALGIYAYNNIEQLKANPLQYEWKYIGYSLLFTILGHMAGCALWMRIAASFDMRTSWPHAGKAWFLSRLGRYVPGKISILLMRFDAYEGQSKTKVSTATITEAYTSLCAVTLLLLLFALTSTPSAAPSVPSVFVMVTILLALLHPWVMKLALGFLGQFLPIPMLHALPKHRDNLGFTGAHIVAMLLHGFALFMAFNAIGQVEVQHYLLVTSTFYIAGLIGMLAVFAPSGLGVREVALVAMLSNVIEPATLLVGVVLIRLVGIVSELLLSGFFVVYERVAGADTS